MTNERVYYADEGEFVDFATLDDWQERDQRQTKEIERLRKALDAIDGHLTNLQPHLANGLISDDAAKVIDAYVDQCLALARGDKKEPS